MSVRLISHVSLTKSVEAGMLDEFIEELTKNLMLDELLCGEASPVDFLKEQMIESANQCRLNSKERQLARLKEEIGK